MGESFFQDNSLVTHILFELCLLLRSYMFSLPTYYDIQPSLLFSGHTLEQLEFKLEKIPEIQKHAGKVRKICCLYKLKQGIGCKKFKKGLTYFMNGPCAAAVTSLYLELEAAAELSPFISMIPFVPSFFVSGFRGNAICIGFWKYTYLIYLPTRLLLSISHKPLPKPPSSLKAARRLIDYNKLHEKNP